MNADNILFRCSSLGHIMVENRSVGLTDKQVEFLRTLEEKLEAGKITDKQNEERERLIAKRDAPPELAKGVITHLIDKYVSEKYDRFTEVHSRVLDKGNETEEDSLTIISRITKDFYVKNEQRLKNKFVTGVPDMFKGKSIKKAKVIRDAKSSWDIFTFNRSIRNALDSMYYWQGQGYMDLTGADVHYVDYCLNNTPLHLIDRMLRIESYSHEDGNIPNWIELQIIANHVYDRDTFEKVIAHRGVGIVDENCEAIYMGFVEVPLEERHFAFEVPRNDDDIQKMHEQIVLCREWMNENLFKSRKQLQAA